MMRIRIAALLAALSTPAAAQVGHTPETSPYRDIDTRLRLGVFAGPYFAAKDPARVFPKNAVLTGLQLDLHVGGPGDLTFRLGVLPTTRNELDPTLDQGQRIVATPDVNLGFAEVGLSFHLTGKKSWHSLAPLLYSTVGIVSDFRGADGGGYQHGSTFAFGYGFGVRYIPTGKRVSFRVDLGSYLYSVEYPDSYYVAAGDGTRVLTTRTPKSSWRNNGVILFGASYRLFR
ncbi:MAG TPA: hypothetical protein VJR92_14200 [Gemmatimonadaceae bacterium]|nr:hypothetical protein [Gemmatimonadaceae bacterium]